MNGPRDDDYDSLRDLMGYSDEPQDSREPEDVSRGSDSADDQGDGDLALPPGLPEEYAEAYRAGYERARREEEQSVPDEEPGGFSGSGASDDSERGQGDDASSPGGVGVPSPWASDDAEPTAAIPLGTEPPPEARHRAAEQSTGALESPADAGAPAPGGRGGAPGDGAPGHEPTRHIDVGQVPPPAPVGGGAGTPFFADEVVDEDEEDRRRIPLVPAVLLLAVLLVVAAFGVGRLLADNAAETENDEVAQGGSGQGGGGGSGGSGQDSTPYKGAVNAVTIAGARASCQAASSVDAAGNPTTYEPSNAFDRDLTTAWRCAGSGKGERLVLRLPAGTTVAEVGLVPGYAKTDPVSGADRYAQNNRITRVRWRFPDGTVVVQRMKGGAGDRSMRTMRIPPTDSRRVVLQILSSQRGPRNTVAISEVRIASPAG